MKPTYQFFRTINPSSGFRLILIAALAALLTITCSPAGGGGGGGTTTVATPVITPGDTTDFEQDTPVVITCSTALADIWYTTDLSDPSDTNPTATLYAGPIPADTFAEGAGVNITIRAIGILAGSTNSSIVQAVYTNVVDTLDPVPVMTSAFDAIGVVASTFSLTVTWSEIVTGFDAADIVDTNDNFSTANFAGGPSVYTVDIVPDGDADGETIAIDIPALICQDNASTPRDNVAAAQFTLLYDDDAPQGVITSTLSPGPTTVSPIPISIDFGMNVVNFTVSDLTVGNGTAGNFAGGPQVFTAAITPATDAAVTVDIGGNVCQAETGNVPNLPSAQFSISYDGHGPTITGVTPATGLIVASVPVTVQIDWNEDLAPASFDASDITLTDCAIANFTQVTASQYTFELTPPLEQAFGFQIAAGVCTDVIGNASTGTVTWTQTYTTAPLVGAPDLVAASDTGSSDTDNITYDITPEFTGTCNEPGTLRILSDVDGVLYSGAITGDWGPIPVTITSASGQAGRVHNITAEVRDLQNNTVTSSALAVTFDVTAPASISVPDLDAASDLGSSNSDNITADLTPGFSVTTDEAGSLQINSDRDGVVFTGNVSAGANTGLTVSALDPGANITGWNHVINAQLTDTAGNLGVLSGDLTITVDGIAPTVSSPDLVYTSDSGTYDNDNITNDMTPSFQGTTNEVGPLAIYSDVEGASPVYSGTAAVSWGPVTTSTLNWTGQAGRVHSITAAVTDQAGNIGTSTGLSVTVDVTGPVVSVPDLDAASDSGDDDDNITNDQTPSFSGTSEAGTINIWADTSTLIYNGAISGGTYSSLTSTVSLSAAALTGDTHAIDAQATDAAGNTGTRTNDLSITVDITAPTVGIPDMDAGTDLGGSNSDNITSDTTPDFTGTSNEAGALNIYSSVHGGSARYTGAVSGNYSGITLTAALDGSGQTGTSHNIYATVTDAAGNTGTSSTLSPVVIDGTGPAVGTPNMEAATDTGNSNTDNITYDTTPNFSGTSNEAGTLDIMSDQHGTYRYRGAITGDWTNLALTSALSATGQAGQAHDIYATVTDTAGNTGTSGNLAVVVDTTLPTLSPVHIQSDNTNTAWAKTGDTATVSLTAIEALAPLPTAYIRGQTAAVANPSGWNFTATYTLQAGDTEGVVPFTVDFTDTAGNAGTQVVSTTDSSSVTFDRTNPTVGTPALAAKMKNAAYGGATSTTNWTQATDNLAAQGNLVYTLYYSTNSSMDTVTNIKANGTVSSPTYTGLGTGTMTIASPAASTYYYNIIVRDMAGNENCFTAFTDFTRNGLRGFFPFNGNANDENMTGTVYNGVVTNALLTAGHDAQANHAYSFDGTGDLITVTNPVNYRSAAYTMSFWYYITTTVNNGGMIEFLDDADETGYSARVRSSFGTPQIRSRFGTGTNLRNVNSSNTNTGNWHHCVITNDGVGPNSTTVIYIDGVQVASQAPGGQSTALSTAINMVFGYNDEDNTYYNGRLDQIRIYNRALSSTEIVTAVTGLYAIEQ